MKTILDANIICPFCGCVMHKESKPRLHLNEVEFIAVCRNADCIHHGVHYIANPPKVILNRILK